MALSDKRIEVLRKNLITQFRVSRGVADAKYVSINTTKNLYHDELGTFTSTQLDIKCFLDFQAPIKVVKMLGWWKEGDTIPILAYIPYIEGIVPKKGDKVVYSSVEGYMSGDYIINHTKTVAQGQPICWVCTVTGRRSVTN